MKSNGDPIILFFCRPAEFQHQGQKSSVSEGRTVCCAAVWSAGPLRRYFHCYSRWIWMLFPCRRPLFFEVITAFPLYFEWIAPFIQSKTIFWKTCWPVSAACFWSVQALWNNAKQIKVRNSLLVMWKKPLSRNAHLECIVLYMDVN